MLQRTNSNSKCLLENWVEERQTAGVDQRDRSEILKSGNKGLLSLEEFRDRQTVTHTDYRPHCVAPVSAQGARSRLLEQELLKKFAEEAEEEFAGPPEETVMQSVTQKDFFSKEFESKPPPATRTHNYELDQPITFWTEHRDRVTGTTQVKAKDTPFRKNDAFSQPIGEYFDEPKPYELEKHPMN